MCLCASVCVCVCLCVSVCVYVSSGSLALLALVCFTLVCAGKQGQFLQATKEREKGKKRKKTKRTAGHLTRPFFSHRLGAGGFPFQESQARAMVATASLCAATLMARSTPASLAPSTAAPCAALTVGRTSSTLNTCAVKKKVAGRKGEGRGKEGGREGRGGKERGRRESFSSCCSPCRGWFACAEEKMHLAFACSQTRRQFVNIIRKLPWQNNENADDAQDSRMRKTKQKQ